MKAAKKTFSVVVNKIWAWVKLILWRKEPRYRVIRWTVVVLMSLGIFSYLTNPFVRFSIVTDPYAKIVLEESGFDLEIDDSILIKDGVFTQRLAVIKSGWHILSSKLAGGRRVQESTVDNIIRELHKERFDPSNPFLISGDHFSVLYNRSLGIFYHSLLDHRTALDEQDWQHRQQIYLKTLAYALQVYAQSDVLSTTIVPVGPRSVALMNIYAYPSDTLYSLLYAIRALQDESVAQGLYRFEGSGKYKLETTEVTNRLVERYKEDLVRHVGSYIETVVDPETGLVRKDIYLSGTKDLAKRESAFYDNVILWRTYGLAEEIELIELEEGFLEALKEKIIAEYWLEDRGYFLEEKSEQAIGKSYYSSDWLIVYMTGFLNPDIPEERIYYERSVDHIRKNAIDQPLAVQYQPDLRRDQLHFFPKWFATQYGATAIWSNWGMEYIKLMVHLSQVTGDSLYLESADQQLSRYAYNIKRYRGYPELYDVNGDIYKSFFYKSILRTGWVVSYEQARAMFDWTRSDGQKSTMEESE